MAQWWMKTVKIRRNWHYISNLLLKLVLCHILYFFWWNIGPYKLIALHISQKLAAKLSFIVPAQLNVLFQNHVGLFFIIFRTIIVIGFIYLQIYRLGDLNGKG